MTSKAVAKPKISLKQTKKETVTTPISAHEARKKFGPKGKQADAESDIPFHQIDAAIGGASAPELTPVDVVAVPVVALGDGEPNQIRPVPWNTIHNSPLNPRKSFEKDALKELAISIYREGLQQNLVVRPHPTLPGQYEIAAGERRWRAIGLLTGGFEVGEGEAREWLELPATTPVNVLVRTLSDLELLQVATAENVQRRRMTPLEEADAFAGLIDLGSDVDDIASRFGYGRRTVIRRIQISRNLIAPIREKYNAGDLTLAQVEVLAVAGPETQEVVWEQIKFAPQRFSAADLREKLNARSFLVKHRQFPAPWYTGAMVQDDLFGDVEPYFVDAKQALELQVKHARLLADKDVKKGAAFASVGLDDQKYRYESGGTGVVYSIAARSGELVRWEEMGPLQSYQKPTSEYVAGDMAQAREQRQASPAAPAQSAGPRYPSKDQANTWAAGRSLDAATTDRALLEAAYVLHHLFTGTTPFEVPGRGLALDLANRHADGALLLDGTELVLPEPGDMASETRNMTAALRALITLPEEARTTLFRSYLLGELDINIDVEMEAALAAEAGPFILDELYLNACNRVALLELWADVGLSPEDSEAQKDETLRAELLAGAADFQAQGFLPRPLRATGSEE
ncbi:ParB/RepB/Spo0J family partition protein [Deinococcus frigens]|uniref:ParB/RepB/Spo0J family partition protein n=1 Tax=Deinococcus frigens TaxID=249403 RepID=UPI00068EE9CC|nr:ParB/RepB/Spo0J family partition protein [Deinococcus frigens]